MNKTQIKEQLRKYNIRPNKTMGQNFLINEDTLKKIIKAADLNKNDIILEVGPGLGVLTKELIKNSKKVITVEKDKQMIEVLKQELKDYKNIEIIHGDVLEILRGQALRKMNRHGLKELHPCEARLCEKGRAFSDFYKALPLDIPYKVVANIPYYLTSHLIRTLLESENKPKKIVLLVQKEVAQRICVSTPKMNLLAISVQFYGNPEIISYVPKENFWPEPKIDSAIIKIANIKKPENINIKKLFKLIKAGFSSPRKQLVNNLFNKLNLNKEEIKKALAECDLNIQARASNLEIKDWINLLELTNLDGHDQTNQSDHLHERKNDFDE